MRSLLNISEIQQRDQWKEQLMHEYISLAQKEQSIHNLEMQKTALRAIEGLTFDNRRDIMLLSLIMQKQ